MKNIENIMATLIARQNKALSPRYGLVMGFNIIRKRMASPAWADAMTLAEAWQFEESQRMLALIALDDGGGYGPGAQAAKWIAGEAVELLGKDYHELKQVVKVGVLMTHAHPGAFADEIDASSKDIQEDWLLLRTKPEVYLKKLAPPGITPGQQLVSMALRCEVDDDGLVTTTDKASNWAWDQLGMTQALQLRLGEVDWSLFSGHDIRAMVGEVGGSAIASPWWDACYWPVADSEEF